MNPIYLLLDIDGVLIPFPGPDGSIPSTHVRHRVVPAGRTPDDPVAVWLDPAHGPLLMDFLADSPLTPIWCTSWREDATGIIGRLLGLPDFPHLDLPRPRITTSHPAGYLWKRDHVDAWAGKSAIAWIDDDFTALDHHWAAERTARGYPTLLVQPSPYSGLRSEQLVIVKEWAASPTAHHRAS
ncbi:hypothetical protein [Streptomyces jumonjinensis]|uniref:hypothetical protein n=1 Tax=Streptomyces jumonjinensis TaxID=1945 RepID=UPI0037B79C0E